MTKRIHESAALRVDPTTKALRVCLISEGSGSSADFPASFFTQENADRLARSLSFPGHPKDQDHPEWRDPLSAIARIGENVTVERDPKTNKLGLWSDYKVSKSRPDVQTYLEEYGADLGLSVFSDSEGHEDASGKWVAEALTDEDPYRSVDLVVAAGRGGKFERVAESLRKLAEASATAEEKEENLMIEIKDVEKVVADNLAPLTKIVEGLVNTLTKKPEELQGEADAAAVQKAVESRLADYDKAVGLITEAHLTESQSEELRARAAKGEDIAPAIDAAKKVLAEALALVDTDDDGDKVTRHLGESARKPSQSDEKSFELSVAGFGEVR